MEINEFDTDVFLFKKSYNIILGDKKSGKSILLKDIINCLKYPYEYSVVITDTKHMNFYTFINPLHIYKRFSKLFAQRCFMNNMAIIIDNNLSSIKPIINGINDLNIALFISSLTYIDNIDYNYIFICKYTDKYELNKIYNIYKIIYSNITIDNFINIINKCTLDNEIIIIDCKAQDISQTFYSYSIS